MKQILNGLRIGVLLCALIGYFNYSTAQPWQADSARWHYSFIEPRVDCYAQGEFIIEKQGDTLFNGRICDMVARRRIYYQNGSPTDTVEMDTNYTYLSSTGDSVMYWQGGMFRTLYDFSRAPGDSLLIAVEIPDVSNGYCNDSIYMTILDTSTTVLNNQPIRSQLVKLSGALSAHYVDYSDSPTLFVNEYYGMAFGDDMNSWRTGFVFPVKTLACFSDQLVWEEVSDFAFGYFSGTSGNDYSTHYTAGVFHDVLGTMCTIGIEEADANGFSVQPNPFSEKLQIHGVSFGDVLFIHSADGRLLQKVVCDGDSVQLDLQSMSSGVYFISNETGREVMVQKH